MRHLSSLIGKVQFSIRSVLTFLNRTDGSLKEKAIRSGVWVTSTNAVIYFLDFIKSIILARLLFPEVFGLIATAMIIVNGLEVFTQTGFGAALIHRQEKVTEAVDSAWVFSIFRGFLLAALIFLAAPSVAKFYDRPIIETIVGIIGVAFIFRGFTNIHTVLFRKELDFKRLAILNTTTRTLNIITVVTLVFIYRNIWALVFGHIAASFLSTILSFIIIRTRPKFHFDTKIAKELFKYGKFITGIGIIVFITTQIDNVFAGKLLGMQALGFYFFAYGLANLPATHITLVVSNVTFPAYSKLQSNPEALKEAYLKVLNLIGTFSIPAAAGIAVLAPEIVSIVYGEKWMPAVGALRILCLFGCIRSIAATTGSLFNAIGKPYVVFYITVFKLSIIMLLIYPLTKNYGIIGTSFAVTGPMVIEEFALWYIIRRTTKISLRSVFRSVSCPIFGSIIMMMLILLCKIRFTVSDVYMLAGFVLGGAGFYFCFYYLFQRKYAPHFLRI